MKRRTLAGLALRTILGAALLVVASSLAHAASPFVAGSHWSGIRVSAVGGGSSSAQLDVTNNPNIGILNLIGQPVAVSISCTPTGVVDFNGLGNYAGLRVHGTLAPQGGTYSMRGDYRAVNVPTMHNDSGRLSLIRSYNSAAANAYFPPDPCFGSFLSRSGFMGRMLVQVDAEHPCDFVGKVSLDDLPFAIVGTINPRANADGSHDIEMLGENLTPLEIIPCVKPGEIIPCIKPEDSACSLKTFGLLLPAVRTGSPLTLVGDYELIGLLGTLDRGHFKVSSEAR